MPVVTNDGVSLYYETEGDGETVAFVGDLGYGAWQWGWQHRAVAGPYESLVVDTRGCGRSDAPPGPYSVHDLTADLDAVLADHGAGSVHLVGAGLGGMTALAYARGGSRTASLTLLGTAAWGEGIDPEPLYGDPDDPDALRESTETAFSAEFVDAQPAVVEQVVEWRRDEDAGREAWAAQVAAVEAFDARDWLYEVTVPAQVVHGTEDAVWPPDRGHDLAADLPRGEFVSADGAGHLAHVEHSRVVNDRLLGFLESR